MYVPRYVFIRLLLSLREYQLDGLETLRRAFQRGHRSLLYVLPTGGGKTVVFSAITELAAAKNKKVAILVHRQELVRQTCDALKLIDVKHGTIIAGQKNISNDLIQVCSVMTLARRLERLPENHFDLIVVDEAHHATSGAWQKILNHFHTAKILGCTGTPERLDGKGLKNVFSEMVEGPDTQQLTDLGYLSKARVFVPPNNIDRNALKVRAGDYRIEEIDKPMSDRKLIGDAVAHYKKYLDPKTAIAFCCTVRHAEIVNEAFIQSGIKSKILHAKTPENERAEMIEDLGTGKVQIICSCMVISEGTDIPSVGGCLMLRPTKSLSLYLQQVGRCLRPVKGKENAIILDHAGNVKEHGLPTTRRFWSLDGKKVRQKREAKEKLSVKCCPTCFCTVESSEKICPECGHEFSVNQLIKQEKGELIELSPTAHQEEMRQMAARERHRRKQKRSEVGQARTLQQLFEIAKERGYSQGWAYHVYQSRERRNALKRKFQRWEQ